VLKIGGHDKGKGRQRQHDGKGGGYPVGGEKRRDPGPSW